MTYTHSLTRIEVSLVTEKLTEFLLDPRSYCQLIVGAGLPYATHTSRTVERTVTFSASPDDSTMLTALVDSAFFFYIPLTSED